MAKAQDSLAASVQILAEQDRVMPEPTAFADIKIPAGCDMVNFFAVGATLPNPSERVNVYLPKALIERVDRVASDTGMSRSSLFGLAVTRFLDTPVLSVFPPPRDRTLAAPPAKKRPRR